MAINQNHLSEDLNGVKCAIVEKNVTAERASFLKQLLIFNKYTVEIAASPPPKTASPVPFKEGETAVPAPPAPETFTVGVTDMMFNPINAIFGRLLHSPDGHVVTLAYWYQRDKLSHDEIPYYNEKKHP
ncbi:MAG TPA: hypothetical protein VFI33_16590 [Puia sp.]|nr:hypothetical protein [Puia sp.]